MLSSRWTFLLAPSNTVVPPFPKTTAIVDRKASRRGHTVQDRNTLPCIFDRLVVSVAAELRSLYGPLLSTRST